MKESRSRHEVFGQHVMPLGHSSSDPYGQGREQSRVASSKVAPQKFDGSPAGLAAGGSMAHVVWAKHVSPEGQSEDRPVGQGWSQLPSASR